VECCKLATVTIASEELAAIRKETADEAPDSKRPTRSFEPMEGTKEVPVNPSNPNGKVLRIGADLSTK
jgi:hypothetical protein